MVVFVNRSKIIQITYKILPNQKANTIYILLCIALSFAINTSCTSTDNSENSINNLCHILGLPERLIRNIEKIEMEENKFTSIIIDTHSSGAHAVYLRLSEVEYSGKFHESDQVPDLSPSTFNITGKIDSHVVLPESDQDRMGFVEIMRREDIYLLSAMGGQGPVYVEIRNNNPYVHSVKGYIVVHKTGIETKF